MTNRRPGAVGASPATSHLSRLWEKLSPAWGSGQACLGWDGLDRAGNAEGRCWVRLGQGALRRTRSPGAGKAAEEPITGGPRRGKSGGGILVLLMFPGLGGGREAIRRRQCIVSQYYRVPPRITELLSRDYTAGLWGGGGVSGFTASISAVCLFSD